MNPIDESEFNELDQARSDLQEGIESSREIVRQSRLLIELSESEVPIADDRRSCGATN